MDFAVARAPPSAATDTLRRSIDRLGLEPARVPKPRAVLRNVFNACGAQARAIVGQRLL
jgi:hypothetical protein